MLLDRVNQRRCLEESGQRLENVDRTHLVLASGKLVLQKRLGNPKKQSQEKPSTDGNRAQSASHHGMTLRPELFISK